MNEKLVNVDEGETYRELPMFALSTPAPLSIEQTSFISEKKCVVLVLSLFFRGKTEGGVGQGPRLFNSGKWSIGRSFARFSKGGSGVPRGWFRLIFLRFF